MTPRIDHIHLTVQDLARAEGFYDALLPALGFDLAMKERDSVPAHDYELVEYSASSLSIGLVSPRRALAGEGVNRRRPGALHHLALGAESRAQVDALYSLALSLGAPILHPPRLWPEYCADYYAFFFKDSEGNELEVVHFDRAGALRKG